MAALRGDRWCVGDHEETSHLWVTGGGGLISDAVLMGRQRSLKNDIELSLIRSKDPYLGFSEVIIDENQKSYRPQFVLAVRYTGNIFPPAKQDFILQTRSLTKNDRAIIWSTGVPLQIGDELELTGDQFYDLHAGGPARTAERKKFVAQSAAV